MQAKKSSLVAQNLFAGVLPTPPADLSVTTSDLVPRFLSLDGVTPFQFDRRDVPILCAAGLASNYGSSSDPTAGILPTDPMSVKLSLVRMAAALSGTLANTAGSDDFTMTGGALLSEACPGMKVAWIDAAGAQRIATIATIDDDETGTFTAATASAGAFTGGTTEAEAWPIVYIEECDTIDFQSWGDCGKFRRRQGNEQLNPTRSTFADGRPRGRVRLDAPGNGNESSTLRGLRWESENLSAMFTQDMKGGQIVRLGGRTLLVSAVTDQFHATITHADPAAAPSVAGIPTALDGAEFEEIDNHFRLLVEVPAAMTFKTVGVAAGFAAADVQISARLEIAHRFFEVGHGG